MRRQARNIASSSEGLAKDANGCVSNALWWPWGGCVSGKGAFGGYACGNSSSMEFEAIDNSSLTGPFQYSIDGVNWQSTGDFSGLGPGLINFQIKDHTGKIGYLRFVILEGCWLSLKATVTDATCGQSNGQIVASGINGQPPYEYSIDGLNFQSSGTFTGLAPGNYTVWVHDLNGTLHSVTAVVNNGCPTVTAVAADAYCGNNDGSITATGQSGMTPYTFSIDGVHYQSSAVFSPLAPGNYTITLKDAAGFTATTTEKVGDNCLQAAATPTNTTCGKPNGAIVAGATGGSPPYSFSIGSGYQASPDFTNLMAGNYCIVAKISVHNRIFCIFASWQRRQQALH